MTDSKDDKPRYTIEIAPGAFDNFEGTQEELDELIADITRMAESGELLDQSEPVDLEELYLEDPEAALRLANDIGLLEGLVDENGDGIDFDQIRDLMREERQRRMN